MTTGQGHVVFVINSLVGGGAERALVNIIGGLQSALRPCRITLVLLDNLPEVFGAPDFVDKIVLDGRGNFFASVLGLTRALRRLKPDVTVSFLARANCATVFAAKTLGAPAIISERVHTGRHFGRGLRAALQKALVRAFYRRADHVVAVSSGVARHLVTDFKIAPERVSVISNPIDIARLDRLSREPASLPCAPYVAAVGRLTANKNFAMTLRGYAASAERAPLVILGEGPERPALELLVGELGLANRVFMPGFAANPFPLLAEAKYLISSSDAEGFPNVIAEAMALLCPVIATDCDSGPAELLSPDLPAAKDDVTRAANGLLVPVRRPDLLAKAIDLFQDDRIRADCAARARARVTAYAPEIVGQKYLQVIAACASPRLGLVPPFILPQQERAACHVDI